MFLFMENYSAGPGVILRSTKVSSHVFPIPTECVDISDSAFCTPIFQFFIG